MTLLQYDIPTKYLAYVTSRDAQGLQPQEIETLDKFLAARRFVRYDGQTVLSACPALPSDDDPICAVCYFAEGEQLCIF